MSNVDKIPATLGKIIQQLQPLKKATSDVWKRFIQRPQHTLFSRMSEDISSTADEFQGLDKGSKLLENLSDAQSKFSAGASTALTLPESAQNGSHKKPASAHWEILRQPRSESLEQKGNAVGQQYKARTQKINALKNTSTSMVAFAQPKLELARSIFQPGAELQKGLSEIQAKLGLLKNDPRLAALHQQTLSMADSGHRPAEVLAQQSKMAASGLNADQILAQTPAALNGATPAAQTDVRVKGDNLDGDMTKLFASWDTVRINLFDGQSAALRELTQTATGWLNTLNTWITDNPQLVSSLLALALGVTGVTGVIGGLGVLGSVIAPVLSGVSMLMAGAGLLGTVFTVVASAVGAAITAIGLPVIALVAVVAIAITAIIKNWDSLGNFFSDMKTAVSEKMDALSNIFTNLGINISSVINNLLSKLNGFKEKYGWILEKLGLSDTQSDDAQKTSQTGDDPEINLQPQSVISLGYQPAKTPQSAINNLSDNSVKTENYTVNVPAGASPHDYVRAIADFQGKQKRDDEDSLMSQYLYQRTYS
ncbi:hypothetical protein AwEntero_31650 [Enterobacterales bacterium]|nr:hypothetical protein AwEntero_31650 [Enterobacterales bacterium]